MKRWVFNIAAGVSLLVLAAALVEWYRGYHGPDVWYIRRIIGTSDNPLDQQAGVRICAGAIEFLTTTWAYDEVVAKDTGIDRASWLRDLDKGWSMHVRISRFSGGGYYPAFGNFTSPTIEHSLFGFHAWSYEERQTTPMRGAELLIPTWFVVGCASILPGAWLLRTRKEIRTKRRLAEGLCSSCGYDLRATPERCPECGTVAKAMQVNRQGAESAKKK